MSHNILSLVRTKYIAGGLEKQAKIVFEKETKIPYYCAIVFVNAAIYVTEVLDRVVCF